MAALFAAERGVQTHHLLQHVFIAHRSTNHADAFALQRLFQAEVGHNGGYYRAAVQMSGSLERPSAGQKHSVTVHNLSAPGDENGAIGVAIERHAEIGAVGQHGFPQAFHMQSAAVQVDVAAVGRAVERRHRGAQPLKQIGPQPGGCAVSAIEYQPRSIQPDR